MNPSGHNSLQNKNILLGVCGGISCYKSADLVRKLIEAGADVRVVMTEGAQRFISELTFQALSGNPVHTDLLDPQAEAAMGHIELARWADQIIIAPATANTLSRLAHGMADDLLSTLCLASEAPLAVAPAMNRIMWSNPATRANVDLLANRGVTIFGPGSGSQACGETGEGRMLEPLEIRDALLTGMNSPATTGQTTPKNQTANALAGTHILLTAGPTREQIDPVRFLSNNSSGKMGFAIAQTAIHMGAKVTLVAGPVAQETPQGVQRIDVKSAADMHQAVMQHTHSADIFIAVAAVADYKVADIADHKIKKSEPVMSIELARTKDILADVAALANAPFCVGFAAETRDLEKYARGKLVGKKLDMIAANPVVQKGKAVFGSDTNSLEVFWGDAGHHSIAPASKKEVAEELLELVAVQYRDAND